MKGNLLRSCIKKLRRHAIESLHAIWKARQESIRKKQVNPSHNRAPVEGHINMGGGMSLGWGPGGGGEGCMRAGELGGHRSMEKGRAGEATPSGRILWRN